MICNRYIYFANLIYILTVFNCLPLMTSGDLGIQNFQVNLLSKFEGPSEMPLVSKINVSPATVIISVPKNTDTRDTDTQNSLYPV